MGGQESGGGDRLKRSVGDGVSNLLAAADEEVLPSVELMLHVEVTVHAELALLDAGLGEETIDGEGDAQEKRLLSRFGSPDRMR